MKTPEEIMNDAMKGWHGDDGVRVTDGQHIREALDVAGYEIVPKEPTETMIEAAWKAVDRLPVNKDCDETIVSFRAMIAAAQTQRSRHPEG